jgi:acyl carrier protein
VEHDTRKFRGPRLRGQAAAPARPGEAAREKRPAPVADSPAAVTLAAVIAEVLPRRDAQHPPANSAELYADLFIDSRRFLMIIRGLEKALGVEIDDEDVFGVDLITYGDLVKFVETVSSKASR